MTGWDTDFLGDCWACPALPRS